MDDPDRLLIDFIKDTMATYHIKPLKRLSQHFMVCSSLMDKMIQEAEIKESDIVVDVGAGLGVLSRKILPLAKEVILIEKDERFVYLLKKIFSSNSKVKIIKKDVLRFNFPSSCKVISNVPYSISSKFLFHLLNQEFKLAILTFQKEFGERLVAEIGNKKYGRLTVHARLKSCIIKLMEVPKNCFWPVPKVDSLLLKLEPKPKILTHLEEKTLTAITSAFFSNRNKKIRNSVNTLQEKLRSFNISKEILENVLSQLGVMEKRPFQVSVEEYREITQRIVEYI